MKDLMAAFMEELEDESINVERNVDGSQFTTYKIGGELSYLVKLSKRQDVYKISELVKAEYSGLFNDTNVVTIGKGSNVIVSDDGFKGCVFMFDGELASINGISEFENGVSRITVGTGMALPMLARQCAAQNVSGLEFYVGIPGSVGGAVVMNAGGHGKQTSDVLVSANVLDLLTGEISRFSVEECTYSYRKSRFTQKDLVFSAQFEGTVGDQESIQRELDNIVKWRRDNQPGGRNVGSVFQNPTDVSAGELIERAGLKGFRIGGAQVSPKHANFIQADESATASDVLEVIRAVQNEVLKSTGYELKTEVRYIS